MNNTRPVKAVVIGSTGQVGRQLIPRLLAVYDSVVSVARRSFDFAVPDVDGGKLEQVILDDISEYQLPHHQDARVHFFCCFGTTKKQAGSVAAFEALENKVIGSFIEQCRSHADVEYAALVSSAGADAGSWFTYPRVKGELEAHFLSELSDRVTRIYRPGFLRCQREERRWGEEALAWLLPAGRLLAPRSLDIGTDQLAEAICRDARDFLLQVSTAPALIRSNADCLALQEES